ncbi:unnamed protein product, partial [Phaeothamnion confervicola]
QSAIESLFIPALVEIDALTQRPRRKTALMADLPNGLRPLADLLTQERLLVTNNSNDGPTIEVAHESLFSALDYLARSIENNLDDINEVRKMLTSANDWRSNGYQSEFLAYGGRRLTKIVMLLDRTPSFMAKAEEISAFYLWQC